MRTRFLIAGLALMTTVSFAQKREIRKAEKAIKSNQYNEALDYLKEAEPTLGSADNSMKAQFYAARGEAIFGVGKNDHAKLLAATEAFQTAISLDPAIEGQLSAQLQNLRASLINGAVKDQNAQNYKQAIEKLYASYVTSKDPSDLYFAAGNAVNGRDYKTALEYYQMLLDMDYTGEEEEYVATDKVSGELKSFDNKNLRDLAVRAGEYIKPETQKTESKKGEILRNMTLIYIEEGNTDKATALMKAARAESPDDVYLMRADADMSYKMGDVTRYNEIMKKIVASDPTNPELYFNLGVGSGEIGDKEKAIEYYEKTLELKPDHEGALINIAVVKLSGEDKLVEEMNSLGNSAADNRKYDELKKQRQAIYAETVPYLERAHKLNPNNKEVIRTLMNIYGQLADDDKYQEMKAKLD
ncbi:tetratricopeptide repeat protein [Aequorivita viscosa]|uniref:Tetratricopeptide repeat-containing protein n=1 Tax=Aequorivita viscosa TaxID=797419 RepID=A0A1M6F966_9FLAO|nr:tetratricopeptide repeat protein [Aequorivita viscosa]SDW66184.1 Tetratricopeptide repeat-containing protein [Aequorivita viscosa]SHI94191.1 Tetratricopeptide repeat-containing protein [Aequorivita viscosa]